MSDGIGLAEALLGLDGFRVLAVAEGAEEMVVTIESTTEVVGCGRCGVRAESQDRMTVDIRDLACFGRPARLRWIKRRWRCVDGDCDAKTWTESSAHVDAQAVLTRRAGTEACRQVGEDARPVARVAAELGVCWWTVMNAVVEHGTPLVDDPGRIGAVTQLGVDETSFLSATRSHATIYATGLVDLRAKVLIDMVEGNAAADLRRWTAGARCQAPPIAAITRPPISPAGRTTMPPHEQSRLVREGLLVRLVWVGAGFVTASRGQRGRLMAAGAKAMGPSSVVDQAPRSSAYQPERRAGRSWMRFARAVIALAVGWAGAAALGVVAAVPASATAVVAQPVPGTTYLTSVACPSATTCGAVGRIGDSSAASSQGVVVTITNGIPGTAKAVTGTDSFGPVVCPSATTCVALGANSSGPVVVIITNGIPGIPQAVQAGVSGRLDLFALGCSSATTCVAVGANQERSSYQAMVVAITNGIVGVPQRVQGVSQITALSCSSAGVCLAFGKTLDSRLSLVLSITNGVVSNVTPAFAIFDMSGFACVTATNCQAVASNTSGQAVVVPVTNGFVGIAQVVAGVTRLGSIVCPATTTCEAAGISSGQGVVLAIADGVPGTAQAVAGTTSLGPLVCPSVTTCVALGTNPSGQPVVVTVTDGIPGAPQVVSGAESLGGMACPSAAACVAVGGSSSGRGVVAIVNAVVGAIPLLDADTSTIEGSLGHWVPWFSSSVSRSSAQSHTGTNSMKVDVTAPYGWGVQLNNWPGFPASPGPMWISFWGRQGAGSLGATMSVDWRNASGAIFRTDTVSIPAMTTTWQQASAGVVAPPGTAWATVEITGSGVASDTLYLDDIVVAPMSAVTDTDTSTFEVSTGHWVPWFSSTISGSSVAHGGNFGLAIDITAPYGWGVTLDNWPGFATRPGPKTIAFAGLAHAGTNVGATMAVDWRDAGGAVLRTDSVTIPALSPYAWKLATADVIAPPGTARATMELSGSSGGPGDRVYVDDVVVADRPTPI